MSMMLRRLMMSRLLNKALPITLFYGQGLKRAYDVYDTSNARCRTSDIPVSAGETAIITVPEGIDAATGAWNADTKANVLYSGWNTNKTYTPTVDVLVKYVFRNFTGNNLDGAVTVTVGDKVYKS